MESSAEFVSSKGNYETSRSSSSSSCQLTTSASQSFKADFGPLRRELEALSFTAQSHQSLDYLANIAPAAEGQPDSSRAQTPPPPIPPRPLYYKKAYSIASTSSSLPDVSDSSVNLIKNSSSQETIFTTEEVAGEDLCFDTSDPILFQKHHHNKLPSQSSQRTFIDKPDPSLIEMESSGIVTAAATNSTTPSSSPSKLNRLAGRLRDSFKQQSGENSPQSKNRTASSSSASTTTTNSNAPQSSNQLQVEIDKLMAAPVSLATQRKCTMNQVCKWLKNFHDKKKSCTHYLSFSLLIDFLDYYFDLLTYLSKRKSRLEKFKQEMSMTMTTAGSSAEETQREWKTFFGKERAHLRKRRTRMTIMHFHIERQVGQGGYGQVFLARLVSVFFLTTTCNLTLLKKIQKKRYK